MRKDILEIIVCPLCKGRLHYDRNNQELICRFDKLAFPVRDDVFVMLVDKARDMQKTKDESDL